MERKRKSCSPVLQNRPEKPFGHLHRKTFPVALMMHIPPFAHGGCVLHFPEVLAGKRVNTKRCRAKRRKKLSKYTVSFCLLAGDSVDMTLSFSQKWNGRLWLRETRRPQEIWSGRRGTINIITKKTRLREASENQHVCLILPTRAGHHA